MLRFTAPILFTIVSILAGTFLADVRSSSAQAPIYVETGRDFRQADQVTMGSSLLTPEEEARFAALRQQAKTRAEMDRVEAELSALLNLRVGERVNKALNEPVSAGQQ